jgi:hypothetical protein
MEKPPGTREVGVGVMQVPYQPDGAAGDREHPPRCRVRSATPAGRVRIDVGERSRPAEERRVGTGATPGGSRPWLLDPGLAHGETATDQEIVMSTDSQRSVAGIGEAASDPRMHETPLEDDPELARLLKIREAEIERLVAQRKPELIEQGIEAYKRDLPRLLAERRRGQLVAYRGNELVAFAPTYRRLEKRLAKKGFTDWGELFVMSIAPLDIDEDDEPAR